jgi:hypothetical protein
MVRQKRKFARVQWLIPCGYRDVESQEFRGWGTIRNISVHGAELATRFHLSRGDKVILNFKLSPKHPINDLEAYVIHARQNGIYYFCGLDFGEQKDKDLFEDALLSLLGE